MKNRLSKEPLVSIGLPVFNRENFIEQSISSILNQTYKNFELIIYDDCSTDGSWQKISSFSDHRIIANRASRNLGPPHPLNEIINLAKGEYFIYLGDWDFFDTHLIEYCVKGFLDNPDVSFIHPGAQSLNQETLEITNLSISESGELASDSFLKEYLIRSYNFNFKFHPHSLFKTKDLLERKKVYDDYYYIYADVDLTLYFLSLRQSFIYINNPLITLRERDKKHFLNHLALESLVYLFRINFNAINKIFGAKLLPLLFLRIKFELLFFRTAVLELTRYTSTKECINFHSSSREFFKVSYLSFVFNSSFCIKIMRLFLKTFLNR